MKKIFGNYEFSEGNLIGANNEIELLITENPTKNPTAPNYQLLKKVGGKNVRLSGLFRVSGKDNTYKGDVVIEGKKERFYLIIDFHSGTAKIVQSSYETK